MGHRLATTHATARLYRVVLQLYFKPREMATVGGCFKGTGLKSTPAQDCL
ncbi:MAG: hypothetical protein GX857_13915 [Bacteroidales bacterium]|nr:hypothetical protein [Bacteroidales bacterium]